MPESVSSQLARVLMRDDTVIFVGSGVSRWSGLPTWAGLIRALRDELERLGRNSGIVARELDAGELLLAASYGVDQLTDVERARYLKSAIQVEGATPSALHEAVVRLGPSCFITTNYDKLLEDALRAHRPQENFEVVTPVDRIEIPSIVQARAHHFVFKPHGDVGASDSIVLTREDYRKLQGSRKAVFEATRTLLMSRPVVFVGFGLRDPDFLLMRDYLFNTYETNPADHLALMPDVSEEERGYWRRHYGIELVSYATQPDDAPGGPHAPLLTALERTISKAAEALAPEDAPVNLEKVLWSLARFARSVSGEGNMLEQEYPLTLQPGGIRFYDARLHKALAGDAVTSLASYEGHLIINGAPGAGKSHSVKLVRRVLARKLESDCLGEKTPIAAALRVPVQVLMRDYEDDLTSLLEAALPVDVSLDWLLDSGNGYFILDGFNEAALTSERENLLMDQLGSFLRAASTSSVIITTRNPNQLAGIKIPVAEVGPVPEEVVLKALKERKVHADELNPVALRLLGRPLFFSAMLADRISVEATNSVHDVYRQLMAESDLDFASRFTSVVSLIQILPEVAFRMIDRGDISLDLTEAEHALSRTLPAEISADEVIDFLLESGVLVATPRKTLAFYHHSVTEYLAAYHLAALFDLDTKVLAGFLGRRDWDQAILLSLGFLDQGSAEDVHRRIMTADAEMGLRSLFFVEHDQEQWIGRSLHLLPDLADADNPRFGLESILRGLPLTEEHLHALTVIAAGSTRLAGTSLGLAARIAPQQMRNEVIDAIVSGRGGYNFLAGLGDTYGEYMPLSDVRHVLDLLEAVPLSASQTASLLNGTEEVDQEENFISVRAGAEKFLSRLQPEVLVEIAQQSNSALVRVAAAESLRYCREVSAIKFARTEIVSGSRYAVIIHYFQLRFGEPRGSQLPPVDKKLIDALLLALREPVLGRWASGLLRLIVKLQPEAVRLIDPEAATGLEKAMRLWITRGDQAFAIYFAALLDSEISWVSEPVEALEAVEAWDSDLVIRVLRTRDLHIARPVLEAIVSRVGLSDIHLDFDDPEWWVDWLAEVATEDRFAAMRLGEVLAQFTTGAARQGLLSQFENRTHVRRLLGDLVLTLFAELSADDFSPNALEWILGTAEDRADVWRPSLLARVATESMVKERLLPLLTAAIVEGRESLGSLVTLLRQIGEMHGRRYVSEDGAILV